MGLYGPNEIDSNKVPWGDQTSYYGSYMLTNNTIIKEHEKRRHLVIGRRVASIRDTQTQTKHSGHR